MTPQPPAPARSGPDPHHPSLLSAEATVTLLRQHLTCKRSDRLPVLLIAAAYHAAKHRAEYQKGLPEIFGIITQIDGSDEMEFGLIDEDRGRAVYDLRLHTINRGDIDRAAETVGYLDSHLCIDHYIFITTEQIDPAVSEYAADKYDATGVEVVILDCLGFLRHFLHLFHRHRVAFLDAYQRLVLAEPDSAVSVPLKEVFLTLRRQAEAEE